MMVRSVPEVKAKPSLQQPAGVFLNGYDCRSGALIGAAVMGNTEISTERKDMPSVVVTQ